MTDDDGNDLDMQGDSLEARETLFTLGWLIQNQFWRQYRFKFQSGWICAALLDDNDFAMAIAKGREIYNQEGGEIAEDFFVEIWNRYLEGMARGDFRDWRKYKGEDE